MATDGRWLAIGAPGVDVEHDGGIVYSAGSVFLYRIDSNAIILIARIVAPVPTRSMWFGSALAVHDGRLLVGAPGAEIVASDGQTIEGVRCGLAYLYDLALLANGLEDTPLELEPPSIEAGAGFGQSVALTDGIALVGAPGTDASLVKRDGSVQTIEDAGKSALFELPWRGATQSGGALVPTRILEGPSTLPMSLFATDAAFVELRPGGGVLSIQGHLYIEEESHGPSPGVAAHRVR